MALAALAVNNPDGDIFKSELNQSMSDYSIIRSGLQPVAVATTITKATVDANTVSGYRFSVLSPSFPYSNYVGGIWITSNISLLLRISLQTATNNFPQFNQFIVIAANQSFYIKIGLVVRNADTIGIYTYKWLDAATTDAAITAYYTGYTMQDEVIKNTKIRTKMVGDSINNGSSGTRIENMYIQLMKNQLRKQGVSISIPTNRSVSGSSTNDHMPYFRNGTYLDSKTNLYVIALGANDSAIIGNSKAAYKANINEIVDLLFYNESNAPILLLAPTLNENNTTEALNVQYRAAIAEIITASASIKPNVVFGIDLGTGSFDRTNSTNYMSTDTAGSRIHPSDIGNLAIFNNCIVPYLASTPGLAFITTLNKLS